MSLFETLCESYCIESIIDEPKKTLAPAVWADASNQETPILKPEVVNRIMGGIEVLNNFYLVKNYYIIGSILTPQWNDESDIDVTVTLDKDLSEEDRTNAISVIMSLNNTTKPIGSHHINYYVVFGSYNLEDTEAAYDFVNLEWIKRPDSPKKVNARNIIKKFQKEVKEFDIMVGELNRDLIDWDEIKSLDAETVEGLKDIAKKKYKEIITDVKRLVDAYKEIDQERKEMYKNPLTPEQIKKYHSKTRMPQNVVYKMLERYHYLQLLKGLASIAADGKITPTEISSIKSEALDHKVNHRHRRAGGGLNTNRKSVNLVPDYVKADPSRNKSVDDIRNGKIRQKMIGKFEAMSVCSQYNCACPENGKSTGLGKTGIWLYNQNGVFILKK